MSLPEITAGRRRTLTTSFPHTMRHVRAASLSLSSLELRARSKLNDRASPQLVQILFTIPPPPPLRDILSIRTDIPTDFAISFSTLRFVEI